MLRTNKFNLFVGDQKVTPTDISGVYSDINGLKILSPENSEIYIPEEDIHIKYRATFIPQGAVPKKANSKFLERTNKNCGIWINRNDRIVGRGLSLGILSANGAAKHDLLNGLRIEIFYTGDYDRVFGSTMTKNIYEKDGNSIKDVYMDAISAELRKYASMARKMDRENKVSENSSEDEKFANKQATRLSKQIKKPWKDPREKNPTGIIIDRPKPTPPSVPTSPRERSYFKYKFRALGETGYIAEFSDSIYINTDHPFYTDFYIKLPWELKDGILSTLFAMYLTIKTTIDNGQSPEKSEFIREFNKNVSNYLLTIMDGYRADMTCENEKLMTAETA